jgi:hypothetical protein
MQDTIMMHPFLSAARDGDTVTHVLVEKEKAAAAAGSHKKKQAKKVGREESGEALTAKQPLDAVRHGDAAKVMID